MKKMKIIIVCVCVMLLIGSSIVFNIFDIKNILLKKIYPQKYMEEVIKYSNEFELDPLLVLSVIKVESNFSSNAKSTSNAIGLMQLMEDTAKELNKNLNQKDSYKENYKVEISENDLYDININIRLGTYYMSTLMKKYR